jgi:hypothetical protein
VVVGQIDCPMLSGEEGSLTSRKTLQYPSILASITYLANKAKGIQLIPQL